MCFFLKRCIAILLFCVICLSGCGSHMLSSDVKKTMTALNQKYQRDFNHYKWYNSDFYTTEGGFPYSAKVENGTLHDKVVSETVGGVVAEHYAYDLSEKDINAKIAVLFVGEAGKNNDDSNEIDMNITVSDYMKKYNIADIWARVVIDEDTYEKSEDWYKTFISVSESIANDYNGFMTVSMYVSSDMDKTEKFFGQVPVDAMSNTLIEEFCQTKDVSGFGIQDGKCVETVKDIIADVKS